MSETVQGFANRDAFNAYHAQHSRDRFANPREVATTCKIKNPARRKRCAKDLRKWLLTYTPEAFYCDFGPDHEKLIQTTQTITLDGGRVVAVLPRSSGKTSIFQRAILWATLNGHARFAVLITADEDAYRILLEGIRTILEYNERIGEDYPEITTCVRALEGVPTRAQYQLWESVPTKIQWKSDRLRFPDTPVARKRGNAGAILRGGGLTGSLRGMVGTNIHGKQIRPDLLLIDDPQTRQSAKSPTQVQERLDIMNGDLMKMSGVGRKISAMAAATVIYPDDLACRLLDKETSPDWHPIRVPMLYQFPRNMEAWEAYDNLRRQELWGEVEPGAVNKYYEEHREQLDDGAKHYWPQRIDPGKVSAIQSAMEDYFKDPRSFASEYQNEPELDAKGDLVPLVPSELAKRQGVYKRGEVPDDVSTLTCHVDCQATLLYWTVIGWTEKFGGYVIDYGTYPEQRRNIFYLRQVTRTLQKASPGNDDGGALRAGIANLVRELATRRFVQGDGELGITRGLVDARYRPEDVEAGMIAAEVAGGVFMPCYGVGVSAKNPRMLERWTKKDGAKRGHYWILQRPGRRKLRSAFIDTNYWKSQVYGSWQVPKEHSEALNLWKAPKSRHQMFCDHMAAEVVTRVEANGRIIDEWDLPSNHPDNHFWDNVVGCAAAASMQGIRKLAEGPKNEQPRRKRRYGTKKLRT